MSTMLRVLAVTLISLAAGPSLAAAQTAVTAPSATSLSPPEMEKFLLDGRVVKNVRVLKGVTDARQVTLRPAPPHTTHSSRPGHRQTMFEVAPKQTEIN